MNCDSGHAGDPHAVRHDLVVFGATSFVGQILCRYLADRYGADPSMRWAVAGRSASKLETLRSRFGRAGAMVELIVVDAADEVGLWRMCEGAKVVVSTVGPYALYGEQLVKVCAESGTDYCDLSGEVQWIRRMIERYGAAARASGARIVHCCGFDSIPSDLGVWLLQREAQAAFGRSCSRVKLRVKAVRGGFSGGTVASLLNVVKEAEANPAVRIELADPYSLCFESSFVGVQQPSDTAITFDDDFASWTAPFVMSGINTRVVHRSNALLGYPYGREFV
ncbi:MAG: saccharopine dehydrogenase family protein, partial [Planctomycetia bacterium]